MTRKSSEKRQRQPVDPPLDAEELYQRYLRVRAEKRYVQEETDNTVKEIKKANGGDILS